jgi:hypothetical protein
MEIRSLSLPSPSLTPPSLLPVFTSPQQATATPMAELEALRRYPKQASLPHAPTSAPLPMTMATERYHDSYGNEVTVAIEESTSISPDRFTELWESLEPLASFGSFLLPEPIAPDQKLEQIVQHLHRNSFYVIAAGLVDSTATLYGFLSGAKRLVVTGGEGEAVAVETGIYFFLELKVYFTEAMDGGASGETGAESWSFECVCKSTDPEVSPLFIQRMHLGDIFQQYQSPLLSGPGAEE